MGLFNRFLFVFFLLFNTGIAQEYRLQELKQFYKNQNAEKPIILYQDTLSEILQVILIRHGEPDLNKKGWRNRKEAIQFMIRYDSALVIPFSKKPLAVDKIPIDTILHSSLPRAKNTAQTAFGDTKILIGKNCFIEFERKVLKWPNIKMPTSFWNNSSRALWFLGLNDKNIEPFRQAKKRANSNAHSLSTKANNETLVILVAHGLHNRYVKKYLKKAGWKLVYNSGHDYLSVKIMAHDLKYKKTKRKRTIYDKCDCS